VSVQIQDKCNHKPKTKVCVNVEDEVVGLLVWMLLSMGSTVSTADWSLGFPPSNKGA